MNYEHTNTHSFLYTSTHNHNRAPTHIQTLTSVSANVSLNWEVKVHLTRENKLKGKMGQYG